MTHTPSRHRSIFAKALLCSLGIAIVAFASSCSEDFTSTKQPLTIASSYDSTSFSANSATELSLRTALQTLTNEVKKGKTVSSKLDALTLGTMYQEVSAVTTAHYRLRAQDFFTEAAKASGGTYDPRKLPSESGEGGVFGGYLFDENGLEMEQMIDKGSFAAALYNHALSLMNQPMSVANTDKILRIFGAHPAFANTDNSTNPNRDIHGASYTARRDKNDGNGFYSQLKVNFLKAQSAANAGTAYQEEYNQAMAGIRLAWEKAIMATVINYCYAAKTNLSKTNPTDAEIASALHAYGEGVGFLSGWRTITQKNISDAQLDEFLTLLLAPHNATPTSYRFVQDAFNTVGSFDTVVNKIATIYGFTAQDLEDFKQNWVSVQQRK